MNISPLASTYIVVNSFIINTHRLRLQKFTECMWMWKDDNNLNWSLIHYVQQRCIKFCSSRRAAELCKCTVHWLNPRMYRLVVSVYSHNILKKNIEYRRNFTLSTEKSCNLYGSPPKRFFSSQIVLYISSNADFVFTCLFTKLINHKFTHPLGFCVSEEI